MVFRSSTKLLRRAVVATLTMVLVVLGTWEGTEVVTYRYLAFICLAITVEITATELMGDVIESR